MRHNLKFMVLAMILTVALPAEADVPDFLTYSGRLTDGTGEGQSLMLDLTLALHQDPVAGEVLWQQDYPAVLVVDGYFTVVLNEGVQPDEQPPLTVRTVILAHDELWVSVSIEGGPEFEPRTAIGSTPYAVRSGNSASLGWSAAESKAVVAVVGDSVGIGTTEPTTALHVEGEVVSIVNGREYFMVPKGGIIMWSGTIEQIPDGWAPCDGSNGTPDLRDRFVVGAGGAYVEGDEGGLASHALSVDEMPSHTHTQNAHGHGASAGNQSKGHVHSGTTASNGSHNHTAEFMFRITAQDGGNWNFLDPWGGTDSKTYSTNTTGQHSHDFSTGGASANHSHAITVNSATATNQSTGAGVAHENRPPYYALAFIMKL